MSDQTPSSSSNFPLPALSQSGGEFYIPSLDGIRAISFLLVFFHHGTLMHIVPGGFGVTTFFFLSGYLITTLLRLEAEKHGRISLKKFYLRRVLRILPPLYLSLLFSYVLVVTGILDGEVNAAPILAQVLHVVNYFEFYAPHFAHPTVLPGTGVLWSLAVEEHFYLFFPLCYILLRRFVPKPATQFAILGAVCALVLVWRLILVHQFHILDTRATQFRASHATDARIDSLLFGCMLAIWGNPAIDRRQMSNRSVLILAAIALPMLLLTIAVQGDLAFRETYRYTLQSVLLIPLFILVIRFHQYWPFKALNWRWVRFLGVLSYSLYLFHVICITIVEQHLPHLNTRFQPLLRDAIALALSIVVATVVHYLVERPCAALRKRLGRVGSPVRAATARAG